ncbi:MULTISPECIES: hypothetical protein [unclassified Sphingomonas]|uniref:hypothetical protein n=1 Tax=unclassified Sphingomonas TaxID=196159 RepID=UPI001F5A5CCC|nr:MULTISPECIES: hypothetical protein [unclassified Sphingomonas]
MPIKQNSPQTEPGVVSVEQGQIILDGPDGVAVAMTAAAAAETGRRLIAAAEQATGSDRDAGEPVDGLLA